MASEVRTRQLTEEYTVYTCDHCGADIGPAPIQDRGGHSVVVGVVAPVGVEPYYGEVCLACAGVLRTWMRRAT